jgi:hypothetical protein
MASLRPFSHRRAGGLLARLAAALAVACCAAALGAPSAHAFGSVWGLLDQRSEHERVTRAALGCGVAVQPPECFQPVSLDNLAGKSGTWGAVAAPDNLIRHLFRDRDYWHCDNADWVDPALHGLPGPYPQTRRQALDKLRECLQWGKDKLYDGGENRWSFPKAAPRTGAVATAARLIKANGRVDDANPGVGFFSTTCTFNGWSGRAKCDVLEPFGYVLHMAEDFYAHTNWADRADPRRPLSLTNPIGLGNRGLAPFLDLRGPLPSDAGIPANFSGSCYPKKHCAGRVIHGEDDDDLGLNKDKGLIDVVNGSVRDPKTPRGAVVVDGTTNVQRAVTGAVSEAVRQWRIFRAELAQRHGTDRAAKMICALVLDRSETCDTRNVVVAIDTNPPVEGTTASAAAARPSLTAAGARVLGRLTPTDRVAVVTFDSATGDQDVDPFVAPGKARIDDAREGDAAPDPSTRGDGRRRGDDPTVAAPQTPAPKGRTQPGAVTHGSEEGAERHAEPVATAAQRGGEDSPAARALRDARGLLDRADAPRGQQGVVLIAREVGSLDALLEAIRALGRDGAYVSVLLEREGPVAPALVAAVEATGGTLVATRDRGEQLRFAEVADAAGLTRLDDVHADQEAPLDAGDAPIRGITERGADLHDVERLRRDATLTLRPAGAPLTLQVTDVSTGRVVRSRATRRRPTRMRLGAAGNHEVEVLGPAGRVYELELDR